MGGISRSLITFRGSLLKSLLERRHDVIACAGEFHQESVNVLEEWGVRFVLVRLFRAGMRPWDEFRTAWELYCLIRKIQPDVVLAYTVKPVIWGGLAARLARVTKVYSLITGIGYAFLQNSGIRATFAGLFASILYKLSLKKSHVVFFQNPDDLQEFSDRSLVTKEQCLIVNGSGVDLGYYALAPLPSQPRFLMICRLLTDKGVREYVQAARIIQEKHSEIIFQLVGALDQNPASVSESELESWKNEGVIEYLGVLEDVRPALAQCSVYVLPSYREGTPRTILEAMSMGRPIITTSAPGCRETIMTLEGESVDKDSRGVIKGKNGFCVPVRNVGKLVEGMEQFILHPELIHQMGQSSREIAEQKYDAFKVNEVMLRAMGL